MIGPEIELFENEDIKVLILGYMKMFIEEGDIENFTMADRLFKHLQIING